MVLFVFKNHENDEVVVGDDDDDDETDSDDGDLDEYTDDYEVDDEGDEDDIMLLLKVIINLAGKNYSAHTCHGHPPLPPTVTAGLSL